jgi:hypothetical protein
LSNDRYGRPVVGTEEDHAPRIPRRPSLVPVPLPAGEGPDTSSAFLPLPAGDANISHYMSGDALYMLNLESELEQIITYRRKGGRQSVQRRRRQSRVESLELAVAISALQAKNPQLSIKSAVRAHLQQTDSDWHTYTADERARAIVRVTKQLQRHRDTQNTKRADRK